MKLSALDYAKIACDTRLHNYSSDISLRDEGALDYCNYHDGVFLSGIERVYELTGDEKYYDAIKNWIDRFVDADGNEIAQNGLYRYLNEEGKVLPNAELYVKTGEGILPSPFFHFPCESAYCLRYSFGVIWQTALNFLLK